MSLVFIAVDTHRESTNEGPANQRDPHTWLDHRRAPNHAAAALGLFQMDGGCRVDPIYELGSPLFPRAVIHLDPRYYPGEKFVIETHNNSPKNVYIQSATLDGQPHNTEEEDTEEKGRESFTRTTPEPFLIRVAG